MPNSRPTPIRIREHLKELLAAGQYLPGDRLPTERLLSEQFFASRGTVRDALTLLEADGLVVRRPGSGTYVAEKRSSIPRKKKPLASPRDTIEARLVFEPRLARLAAISATSEDLDRIAALEADARSSLASDVFEGRGAALHVAIAAATHNQLLLGLYEQVNDSRDQAEWGQLKKRSGTIENRKIYLVEHAAIVKALLMRDADQAEEAAAIHVRTVRRHMLGE